MQYRLAGIVVFSSTGIALIGIHISGNLWPLLPFIIALGAVTMIMTSRRFGPSTVWLLGGCGLLFTHTSIALLYPETLSRIDPDGYAIWVNQIIESGNISQADINTYTSLPIFLSIISIVSEVTTLAPRNAFVAIPILISVIIPLFITWFTAILTGCNYDEWPAVPAALVSSVLPMTVQFAYTPIAMIAGHLLVCSAFIVSIRVFLYQNRADVVMFVILAFGVAISHRLTILVLALGVVAQGGVLAALKRSQRLINYATLPAIVGILLILQWVYLTSGIVSSIYQLVFISEGVTNVFSQSVVRGLRTSASRPVIESRILGIIARRAHGIILIPIAGLSWVYFASTEYIRLHRPVLLALATSAVLGAFLPVSIIFAGTLNFTRTIVIAEPVLISLGVGCGWHLWGQLESHSEITIRSGRTVLIFLGVALVVAQAGSAPISADHPASYRGYLEDDEATAKLWGHQYGQTSISADPLFAHESPLPEAHVDSNGEVIEEYELRYRSMLEPYTDQSIIEGCPDSVMYRDIKIYRSPRAQVLLWNPEPTLDIGYSRQYDSGKIQFYTGPKCQ